MQELLQNILFGASDIHAAVIPLIIAAASLVASGYSGYKSAQDNKKRQKALDQQVADSNAFYNKQLYTDELSRTENQAMLRTLADQYKDRTKQNQATAAITGATPEAAIAAQNGMNQAYAGAVNKIAATASARKDNIANRQMLDKRQLYGMQDAIDQQRQATWANLGVNAAQLGANAVSAIDYKNPLGLKTPATTPVTGTLGASKADIVDDSLLKFDTTAPDSSGAYTG